jgi:hypothetical protein
MTHCPVCPRTPRPARTHAFGARLFARAAADLGRNGPRFQRLSVAFILQINNSCNARHSRFIPARIAIATAEQHAYRRLIETRKGADIPADFH